MIFPEFLKDGDTIGVTACSGGCGDELSIKCAGFSGDFFKAQGFSLKITDDVYTDVEGRSADARTRAKELMELVNDETVKAVMIARGGDYLPEILPYLDYEKICKNPKWIQGYSDPTNLILGITTKYDIATVYSNNFLEFCADPVDKSLLDNVELLRGKLDKFESFKEYESSFRVRETGKERLVPDKKVKWYGARNEKMLSMEGRMIGGCMDCLMDLLGTPYEDVRGFVKKYKDDGIVWVIEPFALPAERITIGLWKMKAAGWFENAKGFVFGRPCFYDEEGKPLHTAILEAIDDLGLPIICGADVGHRKPSIPIIMGAYGRVELNGTRGSIKQECR